MDLPKHIDTKVWDSQFCVLRGHSSKFLNNDKFMPLKIVYILANSVAPGENAALCSISSGSSLFAKVTVYQYPNGKG